MLAELLVHGNLKQGADWCYTVSKPIGFYVFYAHKKCSRAMFDKYQDHLAANWRASGSRTQV